MDVGDVPELSSAPTPKLSALICLSNAFKSSTLWNTELQQQHQNHSPLLFKIQTNTNTQQTLPITAKEQIEREKSDVKWCSFLLIIPSNFEIEHRRRVTVINEWTKHFSTFRWFEQLLSVREMSHNALANNSWTCKTALSRPDCERSPRLSSVAGNPAFLERIQQQREWTWRCCYIKVGFGVKCQTLGFCPIVQIYL